MHGRKSRIAGIFIGIIVSIGVVYLGYTLVSGYFTRATDERPQDVSISNISETSAKVTWTTGTDIEGGVIQYGVSPSNLTSYAPAEGGKTKNHSVDLTLLAPATTYYFEVFYGEGRKYDNAGVPWTFVTKERKSTVDGGAVSPAPTAGAAAAPTTVVAPSAGPTASSTAQTCTETDCDAIKAKLGKGCSTQEYIRCIKKQKTGQ